MADVFEHEYANQYDDLYSDKDYEAECDVLELLFEKHFDEKPRFLLDLGCGTGNHSIPLARRGYAVTGVDLSDEMLSRAREKAERSEMDLKPEFHRGDVRNFRLNRQFDVCLMMFAVLGYQHTNADVAQSLTNIRLYLKDDGLFLFDVWYGPAVLAIKPSDRIKVIPTEEGQLIRSASGSLDTSHHWGTINYHLWRIRKDQVVGETREQHKMRYFFQQELAYFLEVAGLQLLNLTAFPNIDEPASESSWNVLGVAKPI